MCGACVLYVWCICARGVCITFWVSGVCVECLVGARGSGCVYVSCVMYVVLEARVSCLQHMGVLHHSVGSRCVVEVVVYVCSCVSFFMGV